MMDVKVGQVFQEADNRHVRYVRVVAIEGDRVRITTVSDSYKATFRPSSTTASIYRFREKRKHGGYFLVEDVGKSP